MKLLMIDNYDSFTYNVVQMLGELGADVIVRRNDETTIDGIREIAPESIVISPGPCSPKEAGISVEVIRTFAGVLPLLGVCLGHQSIGYAFGAEIVRARALMHGKTSLIFHDGAGIFHGVELPFEATRYHSLAIRRDTLHPDFTVSAWTQDGEIMGVRHKEWLLEGVQFHPESILTREGRRILRNFLDLAAQRRS